MHCEKWTKNEWVRDRWVVRRGSGGWCELKEDEEVRERERDWDRGIKRKKGGKREWEREI